MFFLHLLQNFCCYLFSLISCFIFMLTENRFSSIGPIYYEYGSMVITYEDSTTAVKALYKLRESSYEDKHLLGNLLIFCQNE